MLFPKDPQVLLDQGWQEVTPQKMKVYTDYREFFNPKTGLTVRFDPGKPGTRGFEGSDHYHIYNPTSTTKRDFYLDFFGNPVPKGSRESHIFPEE